MEDLDFLLSRELDGKVEVLMQGLLRGAPDNYSEYCSLVGEVRGIRYAQEVLRNLRQQRMVEEDI
jgi:hypothetical protein